MPIRPKLLALRQSPARYQLIRPTTHGLAIRSGLVGRLGGRNGVAVSPRSSVAQADAVIVAEVGEVGFRRDLDCSPERMTACVPRRTTDSAGSKWTLPRHVDLPLL